MMHRNYLVKFKWRFKMQRKTYTLSEKAVKILEDLARKTRLKMSTIVEAGILEIERVYNEKKSINF